MYGYIHLCAWDIYVHVFGELKLLLNIFLNDFPFYLLRQSLLMNPELNESWCSWQLDPGISWFWLLSPRCPPHMPSFYINFGDPCCGPHIFTTSTLSSQNQPWLIVFCPPNMVSIFSFINLFLNQPNIILMPFSFAFFGWLLSWILASNFSCSEHGMHIFGTPQAVCQWYNLTSHTRLSSISHLISYLLCFFRYFTSMCVFNPQEHLCHFCPLKEFK